MDETNSSNRKNVGLIPYVPILFFYWHIFKNYGFVYKKNSSESFNVSKCFRAQMYFLIVAFLDELSVLWNAPFFMKKFLNLFYQHFFTAMVLSCIGSLFWDHDLFFTKMILEIHVSGNKVIDIYRTLPLMTAIFTACRITTFVVYFTSDCRFYPTFRCHRWWQKILFLGMLYCTVVLFLYIGIYLQDLRRKIKIVTFT